MASKNSQLAETSPGCPDEMNAKARVVIGPLDTIANVRAELGRLYRAARKGCGPVPTTSEAAQLGFLLQSIGRFIETAELEQRIAKLETDLKRP